MGVRTAGWLETNEVRLRGVTGATQAFEKTSTPGDARIAADSSMTRTHRGRQSLLLGTPPGV
jgi:hypothetical protein